MRRVVALATLIFFITMRESHGWLPLWFTHHVEWWYQEWWFNLVVAVSALAIGVILAGRRRE